MAKKRNEIDNSSKWDLTPIFKEEADFLNEYNLIDEEINDIVKYKDSFTKSSDELLKFLRLNENFERRIYKLYYYANLNYDSDTTDVVNQTRKEKIDALLTKYSTITSFFEPSILKEDYSYILKLCDENEELKKYKFKFEQIFRYKNHVLSFDLEKTMSKFSKVFDAAPDIYSILTDSDMKFGKFVDSNGDFHELDDSNYSLYMMSDDRTLRKNAFKLMYDTYSSYKNTISATFRSNVNYLKEIANLRGYNSSIEASLYHDNVDLNIYNNLIDVINDNLPSLYKYYDMKKELLKLDELHMYDIYTPLVGESNKQYSFSQAKSLVLDSLSVLGEDYINIVKRAFDERWIDIYHNEGKRSGAYSSGFYDTNPYILLNYEGSIHDVSTLAHELGHSVHTYLSCHNNDYVYSSYKIFVAEVASTVNELLLSFHLLKTSNEKSEKLSILNNLLELFKSTIYRQTMFAEFERDVHKLNSEGEVLTAEFLSDKYYELVKKYFGDNVVCDEEIKYEWERIPHFYYNFYVYKYATGLSAACFIVNNILSGNKDAIDNYMKFLSSGCSDYPVNELKLAGVDIESKEVLMSAISMFDKVLEEFKTLYLS